MDPYRLIQAADQNDGQRQMNELANQNYRFVSMTPSPGGQLYIVMEYLGGRAGTVADEARQGGIPSQGPTAERQLSEQTLGAGRL
jgi:hypothetical protein